MEVGTTIIPRGRGFFNDATRAADDSCQALAKSLEGTVRVFQRVVDEKTGTKADVVCVLVRNSSGGYLKPKRAVVWDSDYIGRRVSRYANVAAEEVAGIVDEEFPSTGVPPGELFWLTVKGPTFWTMPSTQEKDITKGDLLVALSTAAGDAAGRPAKAVLEIASADTTSINAALKNQRNLVAQALVSMSSTRTNEDLLVDVMVY